MPRLWLEFRLSLIPPSSSFFPPEGVCKFRQGPKWWGPFERHPPEQAGRCGSGHFPAKHFPHGQQDQGELRLISQHTISGSCFASPTLPQRIVWTTNLRGRQTTFIFLFYFLDFFNCYHFSVDLHFSAQPLEKAVNAGIVTDTENSMQINARNFYEYI